MFSSPWPKPDPEQDNEFKLTHAVIKSCYCAAVALDMIQNHWDAIFDYHRPDRGMNIPTLYNNRDFYERAFKDVVDTCTGGDIHFRCASGSDCVEGSGRERKAYVWTPFGIPVGPINLCPLFFSGKISQDEADKTVLHELGRLYGIGDDSRGTNSIYRWDGILDILCNQGDAILDHQKKMKK